MPLWGKSESPQERLARQAQQDQSLRNLEQGGLPVLANLRLQEHAKGPAGHFTSDLSVNELLLTREAGYIPVSQVMGSSIYHVGWQYMPFYGSGEMTVLTHAYWHARMLALSRMQQEARMLKAHGVIGVRLDRRTYDWGQHLVDFSVMGTAVRIPNEPPPNHPFLSDLSGQEFWALKNAGFYPVGFAFGNCVWYEVASWATMMANNQSAGYGYGGIGYGYGGNTSWYNQELTDFTQAMYQARHLAMRRMHDECLQMGASGVVGADIETEVTPIERNLGNDQERTDLMVFFQAFGTAIVQVEDNKVPELDYRVMLSDPPAQDEIFLDL
jgi:uncharacterized protein YbjQ (UPF0145 family)